MKRPHPWNRKLSPADIGEIRHYAHAGLLTHTELAEAFGVSRGRVSQIAGNWQKTTKAPRKWIRRAK